MSRPRLALAVTVSLIAACGKAPRPADDTAATPERSPVTAPAAPAAPAAARKARGTVHVTTRSGERAVSVEVVRSEAAQARGLMYRQHLPPDDGMLFFMGAEDNHNFWMRNTLIPLDILFIGRDLKVVGIVENAAPRTDTGRNIGKRSLYILEVNGGWCRAHGVGPGAKVRFEGVDHLGH